MDVVYETVLGRGLYRVRQSHGLKYISTIETFRRLLSTPAENEERDLSSPGWHPDAVVNQREYAIEGLYSTGKGFSPGNI